MTALGLAAAAVAAAVLVVIACWRYRRMAGLLAAMLAMWSFAAVFAYMHAHPGPRGGSAPAASAADPVAAPSAAGAGAVATAADASGVILVADDHGHFHVDGLVNGALVHFIVDTGATVVMLTRDDATRAGLEPDRLDYRQPITTANGTVNGADVVLFQLVVGPMRLVNVPAAVNPKDRFSSLLGISFLSRIGSYEVDGNTMVLRQ